MKFLIVFLFSLSLMATPAELLQEVLLESATTPHAKKVVEAYYAKLEVQKAQEIARHQDNLKVARGGKMLYSLANKEAIEKVIDSIR